MKVKLTLVMVIIILYIMLGVMMYFTLPDSDITTIIIGPARFIWNLTFGFLFHI